MYFTVFVEFFIMPVYTMIGSAFAGYEWVLFQYYPQQFDQMRSTDGVTDGLGLGFI